jgi:hypothetical protein
VQRSQYMRYTRVSVTLHCTALSAITTASPVSPLLRLPHFSSSLLSLFFSVVLVARNMYQRVTQQMPQPEPSTIDFADLSAEHMRLHPYEQTLQAGASMQDDTASSVSLAETDPSAQEPVKHKNRQSDDIDGDVAPATLDISQRWYSVVFDAISSLFPLFFLGRLTLYFGCNSEADLICVSSYCSSLSFARRSPDLPVRRKHQGHHSAVTHHFPCSICSHLWEGPTTYRFVQS